MFAKKLIAIAAAVALALTSVAAVEEATHIKLHLVPHNKQANATIEIDVLDASALGSAGDDSSEGSTDGSLDGSEEDGSEVDAGSEEEEGSDEGSEEDDGSDDGSAAAATVGSDEDATITIDVVECEDNEDPMSVAGAQGAFCVKQGNTCVAERQGDCPGPQEGLEFGSSCEKLESGVYGCKKNTEAAAAKKHHKKTVVKKVAPTKVAKKVTKKHATKKHAAAKKPAAKKVEHKKPALKVVKAPAHKVKKHEHKAKKEEHKKH